LDIPERYVWLCLRVGRHVDEFIDTFIGPARWERSVADEEPVDPRLLADEARLLLDGLGEADLEEDRRRWLLGQLESLGCIAARLSGEDIAWADEVERCLGVRPVRTDKTALKDTHRRLDQALSGRGTVRERYNAWDQRNAIPRETLVHALERLGEILGPRAHGLARMPAEESVVYELVSSVPWISGRSGSEASTTSASPCALRCTPAPRHGEDGRLEAGRIRPLERDVTVCQLERAVQNHVPFGCARRIRVIADAIPEGRTTGSPVAGSTSGSRTATRAPLSILPS
jgi:hypothetical protein